MNPKSLGRSILKNAVLVCVLLAAEAFAVVHPLDLDAHSTDEPCKICISVASFGSAVTAQPAGIVVDAARLRVPVVYEVPCGRARPMSHFARGPPRAS